MRTNKNHKNKRVFAPPNVEDVASYCRERNNEIDPQRFVDYYTSNGWKVGCNSMKDWKAAVRNWERNGRADKPNKPMTPREQFLNGYSKK